MLRPQQLLLQRRNPLRLLEREFFIDNLLVRIHFILVMIRWTGLAPWEFEYRDDASGVVPLLLRFFQLQLQRRNPLRL